MSVLDSNDRGPVTNPQAPATGPNTSTPSVPTVPAVPTAPNWRFIPRFLGRATVAWLIVGLLGSLTLGGVELVISLFLQLFLQSIGLLSASMRSFGVLRYIHLGTRGIVVGLLLIAILRAIGQFLVAESSSRSQELVNVRLRRLAIYEILLDPTRKIVPAAVVNARLSDTFTRSSQFSYYSASFLAYGLQSMLLVAVMFGAAPREAAIALVGFGLVGAGVTVINRRIRRIAALIPGEQLILTEGVQRVARNSVLIRALRTQALEHRRFEASIDNYARHATQTWALNNLATAMTPFFGLVLVVGVIVISLRTLHTPSLVLLSFLYLFIRFVQSVAATVSMWSILNTYWPQFSAAMNYFRSFRADEVDLALSRTPVRSDSAGSNAASHGAPPPGLAIRNVDFRYAGNDVDVLKGLSFSADPGSQIAIVGPSGCGKSTLLALTLGLLEPTRGEILVGDRPARAYFDDPDAQVGYVGAEPFLIAGSIRDNLTYGLTRPIGDDEMWTVLDDASLRSTVESLPGRLQYPIAEDGAGLSAGQKQRLCLARALLRNPTVLILDEVSANLDDATEHEIADSLGRLRGRVTTIIVSHRRGLIRHADRVLDFDVLRNRGATSGDPASA